MSHREQNSSNSCISMWDISWVCLYPSSRSDWNLLVKQSYALPTDVMCVACKKQGHLIHTCMLFKGWILMDRISVVWELRLCMNCLRKGHRAVKCRALPMCNKCTNLHHTMLLYWEPEKEEVKEDTHVESLSVSEQVLHWLARWTSPQLIGLAL